MTGLLDSYFSPKLDVRAAPAKGGFGVFARDSVSAGELLIVRGGRMATHSELDQLSDEAGEVLCELAEPPRLKREHP